MDNNRNGDKCKAKKKKRGKELYHLTLAKIDILEEDIPDWQQGVFLQVINIIM